jgi:hypothetical protein
VPDLDPTGHANQEARKQYRMVHAAPRRDTAERSISGI